MTTRVEECIRCGFFGVLEQDADDPVSRYACPICGDEWQWQREPTA